MKADTPIDRGVRFFDLCPSARFPIYSQLHPEYSQLLLIYSQLSCFYSQLPPKHKKEASPLRQCSSYLLLSQKVHQAWLDDFC